MTLTQIPTSMLKSNLYILQENRHAIIIDPFDTPELREQLTGVTVDYIIPTHEHYDHISGANALRAHYGCPILCGGTCGERLLSPTHNFSRYFDAYCALQTGEGKPDLPITTDYICHADRTFSGSVEFEWQGHIMKLTETPGHSPGSICILLDGNILFSGDSLLPFGETMTRFPGGSKHVFEKTTLPYLRSLPSDTTVYPGHYGCFSLWVRLNAETYDRML